MTVVNLYTYTNIKSIKPRDGTIWYILETETVKGPASIGNAVQVEQLTANAAELKALLMAMRRLKSGCEVHIYTESQYVVSGIESWMKDWKKNNWKNSKGEPVAHWEMWKELEQLISEQKIKLHQKEHHSYYNWFTHEAKRRNDNV